MRAKRRLATTKAASLQKPSIARSPSFACTSRWRGQRLAEKGGSNASCLNRDKRADFRWAPWTRSVDRGAYVDRGACAYERSERPLVETRAATAHHSSGLDRSRRCPSCSALSSAPPSCGKACPQPESSFVIRLAAPWERCQRGDRLGSGAPPARSSLPSFFPPIRVGERPARRMVFGGGLRLIRIEAD
jgi:hypothetical protein